jgi:seryl-tRNA synthetase
MNDADIIHVDYDGIKKEIAKLQNAESSLAEKLVSFMLSLRELTLKLEPALKRESHEVEQQLWNEYTQLQQGKLLVLDISHEYDYFEHQVQSVNPELNLIIKDAIDELSEHISVRAETHRAHIDLLEIRNTRRFSLSAIIVSATIAYLAVWEYSVREFIGGAIFPSGLSPALNYVLSLLTLVPVFVAVFWALLNRRKST